MIIGKDRLRYINARLIDTLNKSRLQQQILLLSTPLLQEHLLRPPVEHLHLLVEDLKRPSSLQIALDTTQLELLGRKERVKLRLQAHSMETVLPNLTLIRKEEYHRRSGERITRDMHSCLEVFHPLSRGQEVQTVEQTAE